MTKLNRYSKQIKQGLSALALAAAASVAQAELIAFDTVVEGTDNLYHTDWGHWFTPASDGAIDAVGAAAATAVAFDGQAHNFQAGSVLTIAASGQVTDAGSVATGPEGCVGNVGACAFADGDYFYNTVYSLIGLWSASPDEISYITVGDSYGDWRDAVFEVGAGGDFDIPDVSEAYLFLANNDGLFADNTGSYVASLSYEGIGAEVPVPGAAYLFLTGLFSLVTLKRRK